MEQRVYRGSVSPEELAATLIATYDPQPDLQAQQIGHGDTILVQIGEGDTPDKIRHAVTVGIARTSDGAPGIVVTMGQRQWISSDEAKHAAFWGLISLLITPWALFMLLWPLSEAISSSSLPGDIWNLIETHVQAQGVTVSESRLLTHPHSSV